ncbi:MAG: hypothetical protein ACREEM_24080, partial [Blastocatellia bacterium]
MKKIYTIALCVMLFAAMVVMSATSAAAQTASTTTAQDSGAKAHQGNVVTVDASKNELSVKDSKGAEKSLLVSSTAKITKEGKEITLADIKAGDRVVYELDASAEKPTAKSIVVM